MGHNFFEVSTSAAFNLCYSVFEASMDLSQMASIPDFYVVLHLAAISETYCFHSESSSNFTFSCKLNIK